MCKGDLESPHTIAAGDLVSYHTIAEIATRYEKQKIIINGVGIVISVQGDFAKVYWIHAQNYLWISINKLTSFNDLKDLKHQKY